jgi:hypothetical protein
MFGVERGNVDIVLFALLVAALALFRGSRAARIASYALLLLTAMLKLFPVFAWGVLVRQPRRAAVASMLALGTAFAVYLAATADTLREIERVAPQEVGLSYGADVVFDSLEAGAGFTWAALLAGVVAIAVLAHRRPAWNGGDGGFAADAFVAGAGIFVASFALWQNFDYRLIFVLLALPQLTIWAADRAPGPVPAPRLMLASLVASLWLSLPLNADIGFWIAPLEFLTLDALGFAAEELANWVLFVGLGTGLVAILSAETRALRPPWARASGGPQSPRRPPPLPSD